MALALPPPTMFGSKNPIQPRSPSVQMHIQVPCQISKHEMNQWNSLATNALVQLVSQETQTEPITSVEYLRVIDIQNELIVNQRLTELDWGLLAPLTYELDTKVDGTVDNVYAIIFNTEINATQFNDAFQDSRNRQPSNSDKILPFVQPLAEAIQRGDVDEAIKRFTFLCQFPPEQRRFNIVAETPLTPEQVKQQNTLSINITVENYQGVEVEISLRVSKTTTIGDLKEIMYMTYEIPPEVQKWLGEQCLYKNSEHVLDSNGEQKRIYLYILNAAKVGLNRNDFLDKLKSKRDMPPVAVAEPQAQVPIDEEEVSVPPVPDPYRPTYPYSSPPVQGDSQYYGAVPHPSGPMDTPSLEQPVQTIPGVVWACPKCTHFNAWECMRCEKCRNPREQD